MIYLDNSATTRPTDAVIWAMEAAMREGYFNPSALYAPAISAEKAMSACREEILRRVRGTGGHVIFTGCGTEADNLAILGALSAYREGKALYTAGEHPAVREACLSAHPIAAVEIPYDGEGVLRLDSLRQLLTPDVRLICVMQVNNETGAIQPLKEVAALRDALCPDALLHVDGVQGFLRCPMDMSALRVDSYALSGHKVHGPKGIGALAIGPRCRPTPRLMGGGQEGGLRSGTENTPGIAGLFAAITDFPADVSAIRENKLYLWRRVQELIPDARVNGPHPASDAAAPHILNLSLPPVRGETMLHALEGEGILVGIGSACSSHKQKVSRTLKAMGLDARRAESALRFSLSPMNTRDEMERTALALKQNYDILSKFSRR